MRDYREIEKADQRRINFDIRLEYYAKRQNAKQFIKMIDIWTNWFKFPSNGVPTLTLMRYAKLAVAHFGFNCDKLSPTISRMVAEYCRLSK